MGMEIREPTETIENIKNNVKRVCEQYGLFGNVYYYEPSIIPDSNRNRLYIVAGVDPDISKDPPPNHFHPDEIIRRNEGCEGLFYPDAWALAFSESTNQMKAIEALVDYCKNTEFLQAVYAERGLALPPVIRLAEVRQLMNYRDASMNLLLPDGVRRKAEKDLKWFFDREQSTGFRRKWLDFFRSDKYPDGKGAATKIRAYLDRHKPQTDLAQLMEVCSDVQKLEMQEHEFKLFAQFMEQCHPETRFAVGQKSIVDHGTDKPGAEPLKPFGRRITGEEFAVIRKERFAEEGWECLSDVKPSYWEFRDVYYKETDEPVIASAYQAVTLGYAKDNDLRDLLDRGPVDMISISATDFMNFVSLAKANNLRFYIDKQGAFATPNLDHVNILFNQNHYGTVAGITSRMMEDKVEHSHLLDIPPRPNLQDTIHEAQTQPRHHSVNKRSKDNLEH